jgi:hypothetical protein
MSFDLNAFSLFVITCTPDITMTYNNSTVLSGHAPLLA